MNVFISYSHADKKYVDEFKRHASSIKQVIFWEDSQIFPGKKWRAEIDNALYKCNIGILFLSADFLNSDFITRHELPVLLEKQKSNEIVLLIVIVKPCLFDQYEELCSIQAVNTPSHTLMHMSEVERESFWSNLARTVNTLNLKGIN